MAMDQVKKELGIAKEVIIRDSIPTEVEWPTGGYCYYDSARTFASSARSIDGREFNLIAKLPAHLAIKVHFKPVNVEGANFYNAVRLEWQVGDYSLNTDVFIQNMAAHFWLCHGKLQCQQR